jgi:hypothetical protein
MCREVTNVPYGVQILGNVARQVRSQGIVDSLTKVVTARNFALIEQVLKAPAAERSGCLGAITKYNTCLVEVAGNVRRYLRGRGRSTTGLWVCHPLLFSILRRSLVLQLIEEHNGSMARRTREKVNLPHPSMVLRSPLSA